MRFMRLLLGGMFLCLLFAAPPAAAVQSPTTGPAMRPAPPWHRGVAHAPAQPRTGQAVTVTVRADVAAAAVEYQVLDPGKYVELKDPAYATGWTSVEMRRAAGPAGGGVATFVADIPAAVQTHRRLVRYRIVARDAAGGRLLAPDLASASPNFAYFVYDGIPGWSAAIEPKSKDPKRSERVAFPPAVMASVQAYHLIARKDSVENVTWKERAGGSEYKYTGTLVVGGVAYDHVRFRARGGVWRYALGKNMWKFDLPDGDPLRAVDDFGKAYQAPWGKVNLRPCIQLGDYGRRGEQGLYESVGFRLFNLAGVAAPLTHYVQLRIVDDADEAPAADQYGGDFWGLYLAIEDEDGRFLKSHGLPEGNLYKMEGGTGKLEHQAEGQPADGSDLKQFLDAYNGGDKPEAWWRANLDLPSYYSYRAVLECIHHYDIGDGKNYAYHRDAGTGRWRVVPWDLDLTWADHMYGNGEEPFKSRVLSKPALRLEYQNRLREVRDLLFNEEQAGRLIDEYAAVVAGPAGGPAGGPSFVEADRRKWDFHPALAIGGQAGHGRFYESSPTKDFRGMARQMKDYVASRGRWVDANLLDDPKVPATPAATYSGAAGFGAGELRFRVPPYKGANPFAAVRWRLAEAPPTGPAGAVARGPGPYEITAVWESADLPDAGAEVAVPKGVVTPGRTYRARARVRDAAGRWSHWSPAVEFVAGR